jgi:hypothetical protein
MFNLDQAITGWRQEMIASGIKSRGVLDELESRLREDVEWKVRLGVGEQAAFAAAVRQIGGADVLKIEFIKTNGSIGKRLKHLIFNFAGIRKLQFATTMKAHLSTSNLEPRWATYLKATAFVMPAALVWLLCTVFLMPKLRQVCDQAGTSFFTFKDAPAIFQALAFVGQGMLFLTQHALLLIGTLLLIFALLEWRSRQWPRYRRATVGVGTFVVNLFVLVSITLLVVTAIVAGAHIHNVK